MLSFNWEEKGDKIIERVVYRIVYHTSWWLNIHYAWIYWKNFNRFQILLFDGLLSLLLDCHSARIYLCHSWSCPVGKRLWDHGSFFRASACSAVLVWNCPEICAHLQSQRLYCIDRGCREADPRGTIHARCQKLFQESEISAKPKYIFGHMFGRLRILAGSMAR